MAKITLNDITTEFRGQAQINNNFTAIENEFQNKVLYRNNPLNEANSMQNHLDMNGFNLLNVGNPTSLGISNATAANIPYENSATGAIAVTVQSKLSESISVKDFGAVGDGVTDDLLSFQRAWAASSPQSVFVPAGSYYLSDDVQGQFYSFGPVEIINGGVDKILQHHIEYLPSSGVANTIDPARFFKKSAITDTPKVCIVGDSIATDEPTITFDESESMWGHLQKSIARTNPSLTFTFENRAIGGATWTNASPGTSLASTGLTLPSWAGAGGSSWLSYVESLSADMLIFAFGMNDRENFVAYQFRAVVEEVLSWAKVPDIVFITPMVPNDFSDTAEISSDISQNGRLFNAHYVRTWAAYNGFACLDLNRHYCRTVKGFDPRSTYFTGTASSVSRSIPYTAPETEQDIGIEITATASAALWSGKRIKITTSYQGPNGGSWLEIYDDSGFIAVEFVAIDDAPGRYLTVTSSVATPTSGNMVLSVFVKDDWASIKLNNSSVYEGIIYRHGGAFSPVISVTSGTVGPWNIRTWEASWVKTTPALTDYEMWGSTAISSSVEGGNKLNHPTSKGAAYVYRELFDAQNWNIPVLTVGNTNYPASTERKVGLGTDVPQGFMHITKAQATGYTPNGDANNLVLEDSAGPGLSFGMISGGAARINFGVPGTPDQGAITWNSTNNQLTLRTDSTTGLLVFPPATNNYAGIQCLVRLSGVTSLKQVHVGAADSGGTGFRTLLIAN